MLTVKNTALLFLCYPCMLYHVLICMSSSYYMKIIFIVKSDEDTESSLHSTRPAAVSTPLTASQRQGSPHPCAYTHAICHINYMQILFLIVKQDVHTESSPHSTLPAATLSHAMPSQRQGSPHQLTTVQYAMLIICKIIFTVQSNMM